MEMVPSRHAAAHYKKAPRLGKGSHTDTVLRHRRSDKQLRRRDRHATILRPFYLKSHVELIKDFHPVDLIIIFPLIRYAE